MKDHTALYQDRVQELLAIAKRRQAHECSMGRYEAAAQYDHVIIALMRRIKGRPTMTNQTGARYLAYDKGQFKRDAVSLERAVCHDTTRETIRKGDVKRRPKGGTQ